MRKLIAVIIVIAAALIVFVGCETTEGETSDTTTPVTTAKIEREEVSIPIHTSGKISAAAEKKLSFKTGGIVKQIYVDEGEYVTGGKLLAKLDLEEINAQVSKAENAYEKAKRDYERVQNLYDDEVATLENLQDSKTALDVAESDLEIARFNKQHSEIYAPSNGRILNKFVEENELVGGGTPVFVFGSQGKGWKIKLGVADRDMVRLSLGDEASVTVDPYPGKELYGVVTEIGKSAHPANGTYEVEVLLDDNNDLQLASGFVAKVELYPSEKQAYTIVPIEAVVEAEANEAFVYVINGEHQVEKLPVVIAQIQNDRVLVSDGLDNATEVITEGAAYLAEDSKVRVTETTGVAE